MNDNSSPAMLGLDAAAKLVNLHPGTLRGMAAAGDVPGAKLGRAWLFIEADLLAHVRAQYVKKAVEPPCRSTSKKVRTSGGSMSVTQASGYVSRLEQLIAQKRKLSKTASR